MRFLPSVALTVAAAIGLASGCSAAAGGAPKLEAIKSSAGHHTEQLQSYGCPTGDGSNAYSKLAAGLYNSFTPLSLASYPLSAATAHDVLAPISSMLTSYSTLDTSNDGGSFFSQMIANWPAAQAGE